LKKTGVSQRTKQQQRGRKKEERQGPAQHRFRKGTKLTKKKSPTALGGPRKSGGYVESRNQGATGTQKKKRGDISTGGKRPEAESELSGQYFKPQGPAYRALLGRRGKKRLGNRRQETPCRMEKRDHAAKTSHHQTCHAMNSSRKKG